MTYRIPATQSRKRRGKLVEKVPEGKEKCLPEEGTVEGQSKIKIYSPEPQEPLDLKQHF